MLLSKHWGKGFGLGGLWAVMLFTPLFHDAFFFPQKSTVSPQSIVYPLFLNEDGRIRGERLSKLHYRFRRYPTLPKTILLEYQYLQSDDDLLQILAWEIWKTVITLQILTFKQNCLSQSWISLKSIVQLTKTIFQNSAIFIEKRWVENRLWGKSEFLWWKRINSSGNVEEIMQDGRDAGA